MKWFKTKFKKNIGRSTVADILSNKWAYLETENPRSSAFRNSKSKWPVLDQCLLEWQLGEESRGVGTTDRDILEQAKEIWDLLDPESKKNPSTGLDLPTPSWSNGYLHKFKQRYGIGLKKHHGEASSVPQIAHEQMKDVRLIVKEYEPKNVYNMDESGLFWRRGPSKGLSTKAIPGPKVDKTRITITLCTNADGTDRLPLHYIGKSKTPRDFTKHEVCQNKWLWTSNKTAWMSGALMYDWLQMFYEHVGTERKILLLMDNFSAHKVGVKDNAPPDNIRIEFLPARSTSVFQPLDQGIIYNTKVYYLQHLLKEQRLAYKAARNAEALGIQPLETKPKISIRSAVWWFHDAWMNQVKNDTIKNCFDKSTLFDEDYPVDSNPVSAPLDIVDLYNEVVSYGQIQDAMSLSNFLLPEGENVAPVSSVPTIQEIVTMYLPITEEDEANENTEGCDEVRVLNWKAGVKAADQLLYLLRFIDDDTSDFRHQCHLLLDKIVTAMGQLSVQTKITDFASVRRPTAGENTADKSRNLASDASSPRSDPRDITCQIRSAGKTPAQPIDVTDEIDLTTEDSDVVEPDTSTSRMLFNFLCERLTTESSLASDSDESDEEEPLFSNSDSSDCDI